MFFPIRNQSLTDFESQFQTLVSMETIERLFTLFLVLNFVQLPRVFANPETLLLNETTENPMFVMPWESYRPLWQSKFQAFNFYNSTRTVYPLTVSSSWKKNLFVRDALPLEVIYPREHGSGLQRRAKTQVAVGTREACHNDKNNISLPATWTPTHPLLATLFRVNMLTKLEASVPEAEFNIRHVVLAGGNAKEVKNDHVLCYGYIDRADTGFHMGKFFLTRVELLAYICALVLLMLRHCISRKQSEVEGTEGKARRKRKKKAKRAKSGRDTGITIGKLFVSNNEIAKGSHGTIVLDGRYHDVPVAVKRLLKTHHNIAIKEWKALTKVADHENIIRWFGMEEDSYFWYISLERCPCNLHDFIVNRTGNSDCWKASGHPTEELLSIMRGIVAGVSFLHSVGIVHRDLKPSNVLLKENTENKCLIAKVCDMGFSKLISGDKSSIREVDKAGSSGWQPIEQFLGKRQTRAVDAFSLGCVLFFCATGGKHPYGDLIERSFNIVHDKKKLFLQIPEAVDLFTSLLDPSASMRPKVKDVLFHPFLWRSKERLKFLIDTSGWVEREARNGNSDFVDSVENIALPASTNMWNVKFHRAFLSHMRTYRKYEYNSVQDLLRLIRNTVSHYNEFPAEIQRLVGPIPDGFDVYVSMRFPKLFFEIYKLICILYGTEFITEYVKNLLTKSFIM